MQRPGNLRGIGKLGHWQLGAYINPTTAIRTDSSLWKIQPVTGPTTSVVPPQITATPTPTGYTLTSPSVTPSPIPTPISIPVSTTNLTPSIVASPTVSSSPPVTSIPTTTTPSIATLISSSGSTSITPTPTSSSSSGSTLIAPTPSIATLISSSGTTSPSTTPTSSIATLMSSSGSTSSTTTDSSSPAASSEAPPLPVLETRYSYAVPTPGYNYPLPGIETYPGLTPQYNTTSKTEAKSSLTTTNKYFWNKPGIKILAAIILTSLAFKKDLF